MSALPFPLQKAIAVVVLLVSVVALITPVQVEHLDLWLIALLALAILL